jgi:hypothetical protein
MKYSLAGLVLVFATIAVPALAHEHHPPHKGTLVELGEEFAHLELVLDPATGKLTAYGLDGEAEKAMRLKQKEIEIKITGIKDLPSIKLKAKANALTGETEGDTSEFTAQSDKLKNVKEFDGVVIDVTIKGTQFKDVKFNFPKGNEGPEEKKDEGGGMGK